MDLNDYRAKKNNQFTANMIADELKDRAQSAKQVAVAIQYENSEIEVLTTSEDEVVNTGLFELGKVIALDVEYEEY